jgi:hypothetical protein
MKLPVSGQTESAGGACGRLSCSRTSGGLARAPLAARGECAVSLTLQLSDPRLAAALAVFLKLHECETEVDAVTGTVVAGPPHALHERQGELELRLYVRLWEVVYAARVEVVSPALKGELCSAWRPTSEGEAGGEQAPSSSL